MLVRAQRQGRLSESRVNHFLTESSVLFLRIERHPEERRSLRIARRYGTSFSDACYLELAQRKRLPLATRDAEMARVADEMGIERWIAREGSASSAVA